MQVLTNEYFGFYGQPAEAYDEFLGFGKKAKKRREERRARKKEKIDIRYERRRLKNDELRANTEAQRAQTQLAQSMISPTISASSSPASVNPAQISTQTLQTGKTLLTTQQSPHLATDVTQSPPASYEAPHLLSSPIVLGLGVLIAGGILFHLYKTRQALAAQPVIAT